jgi:hypothetical protein
MPNRAVSHAASREIARRPDAAEFRVRKIEKSKRV